MPELSYREAVRDALSQAMRRDEDVFVMGEDIAEMGGSMGVTQGMLDEFGPERVRNTPISEMALVGAGIGAAMQGMRHVAEIMYEDFLTLATEQIVNQAAKHRYMSGGQLKVPVNVRTQGGAGWSRGAQHAQQLEAWFVHIPGLKVVFASTPTDVRGLLLASIYDDNPVVFFEHRMLYGVKEEVPEELQPIELGKARIHREGEDVTVVAIGPLVHEALKAAEQAEGEGISVEVLDPRTLQPLDEEALIASVEKTNRCVVAHEAITRMGFGAEVAAEKGEPLYELDTDKVTQEVESDASGVLLKIAIPEGEVEVGKTIAVIGKQGEEVSDEAPDVDAAQSAEKPAEAPARTPERKRGRAASTEDEPDMASRVAESRDGGRIKASPLARRIARERGVELARIQGTGPDGRIVAEDVERAAAAAPPVAAPAAAAITGEVERIPLTSLRKTIARRLTEAWSAPAFPISMSADMTRALAIRAQLVELAAGGVKPTISDLLTKVCAAALMRHRDVNATFADDAIELHPSANVGIAVASEKGLVVPVIGAAERLTIPQLAA